MPDGISEWNKHPRPFGWTKSADDSLETLAEYCQQILDLDRQICVCRRYPAEPPGAVDGALPSDGAQFPHYDGHLV